MNILKIILPFLLVSFCLPLFGQQYDNGNYPPIRRDVKGFSDLLKESIAKENGVRYPVLKLLPVFTDNTKFYTPARDGMTTGDWERSATLKGLYEYDPRDSSSLVIQIDAQLLIDALSPYLSGTGGNDTNCITTFDTARINGVLQELTFNECYTNGVQTSRDTARIRCLECN